jgi:NADPH:quinone reductase-like Zn-dependent oxidoreductase
VVALLGSFLNLPEELLALGADEVLLDDDATVEAWKKREPRPVLALNCVGGESALRLMNILGYGGTHVTYGAMARRPLTIPNGLLIFKQLHFHGLWITKWIEEAPPEEVRAMYANLAERVAAGRLVQAVDSTFPLEDFQSALARLEEPGRDGKVLFVP